MLDPEVAERLRGWTFHDLHPSGSDFTELTTDPETTDPNKQILQLFFHDARSGSEFLGEPLGSDFAVQLAVFYGNYQPIDLAILEGSSFGDCARNSKKPTRPLMNNPAIRPETRDAIRDILSAIDGIGSDQSVVMMDQLRDEKDPLEVIELVHQIAAIEAQGD